MSSVVMMLFCVWGYTQELPTIIPPSPEISSLGKYLDIPVNLSTGVPSISIPLLNLKGKPVNIPVGLNYHASGIRVNETASRNGLGWSVSTGGMISVSTRGIPDDELEGYINTSNTVVDYEASDIYRQTELVNKSLDGVIDYQSDIYNYTFLGQTGRFFFNQSNDQVIVHQKNDLKITYVKDNNKKILGWKILTTEGITYEFGFNVNSTIKETNYSYTKGQNLPAFNPYAHRTTGWYLTKIIDAKGNVITYTYDKKTTTPITIWNLTSNSKEFASIGSSANSGPHNGELTSFSKKEYAPIFLTKIQSDYGELHFEYLHNRQDLTNDKALTSVKLFDNNKVLIDEYGFDYGYFTATDENQHPNFGIDNQLKKRLYLQRIYQKKGNIENKTHSFTYYTEQKLPNRFSYAQDFWGYYNGKNNSVLYPKTEVLTGTNIVTINGADRKVSSDHAKAYTLKTITYPTKGKTDFIFESNTIGRTDDEAFFVGNEYQNSLLSGGQLANLTGVSAAGQAYTSNLTITTDFPYGGIIDYTVNVEKDCNYSSHDCPSISITKPDGSIMYRFNTNNYSGSINLPDGDYILKIENGILQTDNNVSISLSGRKLLPKDSNAYTGGLRVKEIIYKDYNDKILKKQTYKYHSFDNVLKSSGISSNPPIYYYKKIPYTVNCVSCLSDRIQSNSIFPLNGLSPSVVTYTNVTQEFDDNSKIESWFMNYPDSEPNSSNTIGFADGTQFPLVPSLDYSHRRGILTSEKIFNSQKKIIQEKKIIHSSLNSEVNKSSVNYSTGKIGDYAGTIRYINLSERLLLKEEIKKTYSSNGVLEQKTTYTYDSGYNSRAFPTTTTVTNSKGEVLKTETKYAHDVNDQRLIEEHRIAEPLEVKNYKGTNLLNHQKTVYDSLHSPSNLYLPKFIQTLKGGSNEINTLEDRVVYHSYDSKGNPVEVSKKDGTHIVYIWGYNQTQPIAKIENATLSDIPSETITDLQTKSNLDQSLISEATLRSALNNLRSLSSLSKAQITTFTYNPLIGVTSITDPRGQTMYYEYDNFNRLEFIKDTDGNLLKEYKYKYRN